jgi:predicted dehydrogenase
MSDFEPLRVAIVGCGNISGAYGSSLITKPDLVKIMGAYDVITDQARAFVNNYGGNVYEKFEDVISDPEVELVINLTSHHAHATVSSAALSAGKHVHSEKPLATKREDGKKLLELAEKNKVRLSCSPFTFLGEAQQTVRKAIHDGIIGKPLMVYAEMNWSWIELWHPNPEGFHQPGAGPMLDVGVYPLSILTAILGPVVKALGYAEILLPERTVGSGPKAGTKFDVTTPDQVIGILTFASGCKARITTNFFGFSKQGGIEFHGEKGSLILDSAVDFKSGISVRNIGDNDWQPVPYVLEPFGGVEWGRAVFELAESVRKGTPQRCTGKQAYHVLDICLSILDSAEKGCAVPVESTFMPPPPRY